MRKKIIKIPLIILSLYLSFAFISGVIVFAFIDSPDYGFDKEFDISDFKSEVKGPDASITISDRKFATISKINIIENASESLDIAYCQIETGISADIFFSSLISAAQRGVKVRILLNRSFDPFRFSRRDIHRALSYQPGIDIGYFGSNNLLTPWKWHNLLHDKMIIADKAFVITGGSNIGDRFFIDRGDDSIVFDRDIAIYDTSSGSDNASVLNQFNSYFNELWYSEFTKVSESPSGKKARENAKTKIDEMNLFLSEVKSENPQWFPDYIDWDKILIPVNRATLITNPLGTMKKEPRILIALSNFAFYSKDSIIMQSPYFVPTDLMTEILTSGEVNAGIYLLTNSLASSPNYFAISGYLNKKQDILSISERVYEYHGKGSLHGKTYIYDQNITAVGSFNFDSRSAFLSTESIVVIHGEEFASKVIEDINYFKGHSVEQHSLNNNEWQTSPVPRKASLGKHIIVRILRFFLYPFDFML